MSKLPVMSTRELLETIWPEPRWAVPDYLPVGLTFLAGAPKLGKSWLALQIAQAITEGGYVLGKQVQQDKVLYLALEDPQRRLKERMIKQGWTNDHQADFMTIGNFSDAIGSLNNKKGLTALLNHIEAENYRLVVLDTFSRAFIGDQSAVEQVTQALDPLQVMAQKLNLALIIIDHHRKKNGSDPDAIADMLGSTAKGAMADTTWGLYRERGKAGAQLRITGRDVLEVNLNLRMDWEKFIWILEGGDGKIRMTPLKKDIRNYLEKSGPTTVVEIAKEIERDKGNVFKTIQSMVNANALTRIEEKDSVKYAIVTEDVAQPAQPTQPPLI